MVDYRKDILALVALGAVFAAAVVYARHVYAPCDDAYIYLVYAKNFLAGNGLTYNGIKIQGFTSTLWMLILLVGGVFPERLPVVAETLSTVSGLFVMVGAYWVGRRFGFSQIHALVVPVLLAGTWDFVFYMGNGMETVFLSGMILVVIGAVVTAPRGEPSRTQLVLVSLLLGLLVLSRPECAVVAALIIAYLVWERRYREAIFGSGGALVIGGTALVICRVAYRSWLPNTFYAKTGFGLENIPQGWAYLTQFVRPEIIILVPFVALAVGIIPRDRRALLMVAVIIVWMAQVVLRGGDNLVGFRAFLPVIPLVYMVIAVGARRVAGPAVLVAAMLVTTIHVVNYRQLDIVASSWQIPMSQHVERWRKSFAGRVGTGLHLKEAYPGKLIALNSAGIIPFYSGLRTIDMLGLNDYFLAHKGERDSKLVYGHQRGSGKYILKRKPKIILFGGLGRGDQYFISDRELWAELDFRKYYRPVTFPNGVKAYIYRRAKLNQPRKVPPQAPQEG